MYGKDRRPPMDKPNEKYGYGTREACQKLWDAGVVGKEKSNAG